MKLLHRLKQLSPRGRIITTAIVCLGLLGYVDWITGPNVAVTCFYLIPVCLLTWFIGRSVGFTVSAIHALIWFGIDADTLGLHSLPLVFWNAIVRFVTFAVVVWLVHLCKNLNREVESLIKSKTEVLEREVETRAQAEIAIHRLANELSVAEDVERRRLGQELHESLGQNLSLLKLRMESLAAELPADGTVARELRQSMTLLSDIIRDSRTLTFELYPSMLDQLGLTVTLQHYAELLSAQAKARVRIADFGPEMTLPVSITSFLFRAVKELVTNSLKHGRSTDLLVQIRRRHGHVRIVVNDDGCGFAPASEQKPGLGLAWIRERLRSLSGSLDIESTVGRGARVTIDLPVTVSPSQPPPAPPQAPLAPPQPSQLGNVTHGQPVAS